MTQTLSIPISNPQRLFSLAGVNEENLRLIEQELGVEANLRGEAIELAGDEASLTIGKRLFEELAAWSEATVVGTSDLQYALRKLRTEPEAPVGSLYAETLLTTTRGKPVRAKTLTQREYVRAIADHTLTFGLGPAGTGKTYLAVAMAVNALREKRVSRIILTRPAVEAGESLGFLPGDFQAKVDPYFRPLYDALHEMLEAERFGKLVERGVVEIAPLAYMRGRTLNDSFIILDEAQNTTPEQMKMFLTRIGFGSRVVVTGDASQVDLPRGKNSGLRGIEALLGRLPGIAFIRFGKQDVVRHDLVQRIVQAYEEYEERQLGKPVHR
ncbi:PhoH-like protein [compost metagenome]